MSSQISWLYQQNSLPPPLSLWDPFICVVIFAFLLWLGCSKAGRSPCLSEPMRWPGPLHLASWHVILRTRSMPHKCMSVWGHILLSHFPKTRLAMMHPLGRRFSSWKSCKHTEKELTINIMDGAQQENINPIRIIQIWWCDNFKAEQQSLNAASSFLLLLGTERRKYQLERLLLILLESIKLPKETALKRNQGGNYTSSSIQNFRQREGRQAVTSASL